MEAILNCIKLRQLFVNTLLGSTLLSLAFPSHIFAAQIQIKQRLNVHNPDFNRVLKRQTTLPAGTIVEIPNEFLENQPQGTSPEQALVNWLRKDTNLYQFTNSIGQQKYDYFSKVKIVSIPDPLLKEFEGQSFHMALRYLAERENGISFTTRSGAETFTVAEPEAIRPIAHAEEKSEADCGSCQIVDPTPHSPLAKLQGLTRNLLQSTEDMSERYLNTKNVPQVIANFERTCKGLNFQDYKEFLKAESERGNIPLEVMLGIMTQESAGSCLPRDSAGNYGLFQINKSTSTSEPLCTVSQKQKIATASLHTLKTDKSLDCLENPVVNAREGIRIYKEKFRSSNKKSIPPLKKWSEYSIQERDDIRRAVAGYNGGQTHVNRAIADIKTFQEKYAKDLDTNSFELQRIFFFRQILKQQGYVSSQEGARGNVRTVENLAYTESITGRDSNNEKADNNFISFWENALYSRNQTSQVTKK